AELAEMYPRHPDRATPIAYLSARTIRCEGPGCGAEVPLLRSLWLARKGNRSVAVRLIGDRGARSIAFEIEESPPPGTVDHGTVSRGSATCPSCGFTTPVENVRKQLSQEHGGAHNSRLYCTVVKTTGGGTEYRQPTSSDLDASKLGNTMLAQVLKNGMAFGTQNLPPDGALGFRVQKYGITEWRDAFTYRQLATMSFFIILIRNLSASQDLHENEALRALLGLTISKMANFSSSLCAWRSARSCVRNTFGSQTLSMVWDFGEMNPFAGSAGDFGEGLDYLERFIAHVTSFGGVSNGQSQRADAGCVPIPDDAASLYFTDPPYYDAIPYGHLSGFFSTWLKGAGVLDEGDTDPVISNQECIVDARLGKDRRFFERKMSECLTDGRRLTAPHGIGLVVFAHKSTSGWESQLQAMLEAGWVITASWPIDTERAGRLRAIDSAALASSVHLVCRPRENPDGSLRTEEVGEWRDILQELPARIHEWLPRLSSEGVVGADAIFACLGPALEIFSRYSRVERADGTPVVLREYLEQVWAAVAKEALSLLFKDADAAGLEPDARLTAMWLWTLRTETSDKGEEETQEVEEEEEEDEKSGKAPVKGGFVLEFDAARKIAQGLGANLEELRSVVEVKGQTARLLPVGERAVCLLGKPSLGIGSAPAKGSRKARTGFLPGMEDVKKGKSRASDEGGDGDDVGSFGTGTTTLDRIHQSMLLF